MENSKIIEALKEKSLLELKDLVDLMKEEFGVDPSAVAAAAPAEDANDEPSEVTVTLINHGQKKIPVIKVVRSLTGLGLKEAKKVVDSAPTPIKEDISPEEAEDIKSQLEEAGAEVEVK